jgi:hypothetical protein
MKPNNRLMTPNNLSFARNRGKVVAKYVVEVSMAKTFEVVYYPRMSTPELCVKVQSVNAALSLQWSAGMHFKMAFKTEEPFKISLLMGTISTIHYADRVIWPKFPQRLLQVNVHVNLRVNFYFSFSKHLLFHIGNSWPVCVSFFLLTV